ncbi:hypothetical protein HJFPF1_02786 [Paramyrothecium foliicola]|nr:hypothetical protein HJFPF1_02786 [Paramyrothecium foliicola]
MPSVAHIRRSLNGPLFEEGTPATLRSSVIATRSLFSRSSVLSSETEDTDDNEKMIDMMLVVLGLVFFALVLVTSLWFLRRARQRRMQAEMLPSYYDAKRNHHGLTIETSHNGRASVLVIGRDGQPMLRSPSSPPHSPANVPEIHITFPDEQDERGHHKSGRVLVVRVGDNATVGLEPMHDEQLPAYEKEAKGQFYSLDMNQIGGLKEKDQTVFR